MTKELTQSERAKLRWKGIKKADRVTEMTKLAKIASEKRRKKKA